MEQVKKKNMVLNLMFDVKVNETKKYEQHFIVGFLPERVVKYGNKLTKLKREYFIGQAEKHKETGEWVEDSIRIIRLKGGEKDVIEKIGMAFAWFFSEVTGEAVAFINSDMNLLGLHGKDPLKRIKLLDKIDKMKET